MEAEGERVEKIVKKRTGGKERENWRKERGKRRRKTENKGKRRK